MKALEKDVPTVEAWLAEHLQQTKVRKGGREGGREGGKEGGKERGGRKERNLV